MTAEMKHDCKKCAELSKWYAKLSKDHAELSKWYAEFSKKHADECGCEK